MQFVLFYHSLISDWNHGNAHFLRGVVRELLAKGHGVRVYEPRSSWSVQNLVIDAGLERIDDYQQAYPELSSVRYSSEQFDLGAALAGADVVLVHEWNEHDLVAQIGRRLADLRQRDERAPVLLFHDTHHRAVSEQASMAAYDLRHYDGVLAFGDVIRCKYIENGWTKKAWTWHEAADTSVFYPHVSTNHEKGDLVWIGNWGDDERTAELHEYLLEPVKQLGLKATVYGVRYPQHARDALAAAGIDYKGWLPNYKAPEIFAQFKITVHVPRRPYVESLPGIPTIRVFEALACAIPLISAPWNDAEKLFDIGTDFTMVQSGEQMKTAMKNLVDDPLAATAKAQHGLQTIRARHTCAHRVNELLAIVAEVRQTMPAAVSA